MRVDLTDPELFRQDAFWDVLAWLRANDPVHWHEEADGPGFWVLTRHRDIVDVYADHETFSSRYGMRLGSNAEAVAAVSQRMLIVSDPPDHTQLKRVLTKFFGPAEMPRIEALVRRVVADVADEAVERETCDFIDLAKRIPNQVVCALMDLPRQDWEWIGALTTDAFDSEDPEERSAAHSEIFLYFTELLQQRRERPGDDFVSYVAHEQRAADVPGGRRPLSDEEVVFNCNGVLSGANETTRYSAAGGVLAFARDPSQWELLRRRPDELVPTAVEEILRWTTPGVHALRTALRSTSVAGTRIREGDRVTLWNVSANRDEAVFDEPDRFRVDRSPNRHVTFGHGRHLCLGARLARLELQVFFEALCPRVAGFELTGTPEFNSSNFTWGLRSLPVRLVPASGRAAAPAVADDRGGQR